MNENRFYVYVHKIKETGEVFYVGKGTAYRLINKHKRSKKWYEITENNEWFAEKYYEDLDKNTALDIELLLINELKPVCNKHTKDIRNKKLNEEFLFARYEYSETSETGLIYKQWNMQNGSKRRDAGQSAGTTSCNGYFTVSNGRCSGQVMNHRVVWLLVNGEDPGDMIIDHIDGDRKNNKVSNLRKIHQEENSRNNSKRKDNKTGVVGVHYSKEGFYVATWRDNQLNAFTKAVSIRKYGKELAFALACYYRNFMVSDLSITDRHKGSYTIPDIISNYSHNQIIDMVNSDISYSNKSGHLYVSRCSDGKTAYWVYRKGRVNKNFSIMKFGEDLAKALCLEYKARLETQTASGVLEFSIEKTTMMLEDNTKANNLSGYKGISFILSAGKTYARSQKTINGRNISKQFCCEKLGLLVAHQMAIKFYLDKSIQER